MHKNLFCDNWKFAKLPLGTDEKAILSSPGNIGWKAVDIPHDWLIHQVNDLYEPSLGVYRKEFTLSKISDMSYSLRFEGVYFNSSVFVNGKLAGDWKYGYSTFEFDVTELLADGHNDVIVFVRHEAPNSRWYSGAGIFRPVYLFERNKAHFTTDGIYFSAKRSESGYTAKITSETVGADETYSVRHRIYDGDVTVAEACGSHSVSVTAECPNVTEWDIDCPKLYTLQSELIKNETVIDSQERRIGFRTTEFTPDGFFLNGRKLKMNGVCLHHDLGCLGAAVNKTATKRQLTLMKEMGANAVRTSHNMPSCELMDLCDELGILVDSEAFDMWELKKTEFDYARFFDDRYKMDVESWVKRDRCHPSVVMWSIGNEIYDTHCRENAPEITASLRDEVRKHDPEGNGMATIGSNYIPWEGAQKCADLLKLSGYNYCENLYEEHHKKFPDHIIYGSKTAARVQSRGIYHFPIDSAVKTYEDLQCSSLENCRAGVGDRTPQSSIIWDRDTDFSCGQFIWTGADYIGEPTPYSTKNAYYGQIDTAGLKKDTYYLYQSCWTDKNVIHLLPYWDFNDGQLIDVMAYTNAPVCELFLNGRSLGKHEIDVRHGKKLSAEWRVPYESGELKAIAYDADGNVIGEDIRRSFGDGVKICLFPDKTELKADGEDMIFLEISTADKDGNIVENARNRMFVTVSGAARLVGLDSGDSTDYDEYKGGSKKLFSGRLVAYIAASDHAGDIEVTVRSAGFPDEKLMLKAVPSEIKAGISCIECNAEEAVTADIPVRKIALKATSQALSPDCTEAEVTAHCLPLNTTMGNISWKAVTNSGVATNIAEVISRETSCTVKALGDGEFRLRCTADNGKPAPEVISELEFSVSGMGTATLDPYDFVYGTLYSFSDVTPEEDIQGGISPGDSSYVGFKKVDFGDSGTDEFILPIIYWFVDTPFDVEIMLDSPDSKPIAKAVYKHEFVWQTYFDMSVKSDKVIKGVHDLYFRFKNSDHKISFKGFVCKQLDKAYEVNNAADCDRIYGDTFTVSGSSVTHIGNNVSLEFDGMDFADGVSSLTIKGKTHNDVDSIHVFFNDENGRERRIIEFERSDETAERTFAIDPIKGKFKVIFMFLPGCDFDFDSFKFNK